jgi:hypothetical protein
MPNLPRVVSAPAEHVPVVSARFASRIAVCTLLTTLDAGVIVDYAPTLYQVSLGHPFWLVCLTSLFVMMLVSLVRVWGLLLRRRFR